MSKNVSQGAKSEKESRLKYFIGMIDIKADTSMTRIYSAMKQSEFINPKNK